MRKSLSGLVRANALISTLNALILTKIHVLLLLFCCCCFLTWSIFQEPSVTVYMYLFPFGKIGHEGVIRLKQTYFSYPIVEQNNGE